MIALFVLKLSAGITLMWLLMPRRNVTDGFFRIQMRLLLGTTVLTALLLARTTTWAPVPAGAAADSRALPQTGADAPRAAATGTTATGSAAADSAITDSATTVAAQLWWLQVTAACIAYPGSIFWALGRRGPGNVCIWLLGLLCLGSLLLHAVRVPQQAAVWLQVLSDLSSAAVLGATLTGMLLGHWYLTTPTMSIQPLWWFNRTLLLAAGCRLLASAAALWQFGFAAADTTQWLWLAMRLVGGVLAPAVVWLLVSRILKYRNTQSATGVLFAGLILVFMGEMTAALLERQLRIPY